MIKWYLKRWTEGRMIEINLKTIRFKLKNKSYDKSTYRSDGTVSGNPRQSYLNVEWGDRPICLRSNAVFLSWKLESSLFKWKVGENITIKNFRSIGWKFRPRNLMNTEKEFFWDIRRSDSFDKRKQIFLRQNITSFTGYLQLNWTFYI